MSQPLGELLELLVDGSIQIVPRRRLPHPGTACPRMLASQTRRPVRPDVGDESERSPRPGRLDSATEQHLSRLRQAAAALHSLAETETRPR
jgi:hypothetical protein